MSTYLDDGRQLPRRSHQPADCSPRPRRGVALIIVLGLISVAVALSYAMMRSQATSAIIYDNLHRKSNARRAAMAGISAALQRMHQSNWEGIESVIVGNISLHASYRVTFETGDPRLQPTDSDYAEFPYRVTITSLGKVTDPVDANRVSRHRIQAVVQLVRRSLSAAPANWPEMQQYTVYQWANQPFRVEVPARIEGPVFAQGALQLCTEYPPDSDYWYEGLIDEVAILHNDLTDSEIAQIDQDCNSGLLVDTYSALQPDAWWRLNEPAGSSVAVESYGGYDGTYRGATAGVAASQLEPLNTAIRVGRYDQRVDIDPLDFLSLELTILAWIKPTDFGTQCALVSQSRSSAGPYHFRVGTVRVEGNVRLQFQLQTLVDVQTLTAVTNLNPDVWTFVAAVYDGTQMRLYQDGIRVGERSIFGGLLADPTVRAQIGNPPPGSPRVAYLRDLERMRQDFQQDLRPFDGPLNVPFSRCDSDTLSLVSSSLNVQTNDIAIDDSTPLFHPGTISTYQLYPGGKQYTVPALDLTLSGVTYQPDPATNPLGIFRRSGALNLADNVVVQGTIVTDGTGGDLHIQGDGIQLTGVNLPPLADDNTTYQLPVAIIGDGFHLHHSQDAVVRGLVATFDHFEMMAGSALAHLSLEGRLLTRRLTVAGRTEWVQDPMWWRDRLNMCWEADGQTGYFPTWLQANEGLDSEPLLTIKANPSAVAYHWQDWTQPVFVPHPDDPGLRWDLVGWKDNL